MNSGNVPEAQFSIYRIDFERISEVMTITKKQTQKGYYEEIKNAIINLTIKKLHEKLNAEYRKVKYLGFEGIVFKTMHKPIWQDVIIHMLSSSESKKVKKNEINQFLLNVNVSYLLIYKIGKSIYAMTGGYGSHYISKIIDRNFGLYLIPKIIKIDNPVIKQILQNNLTGNQFSMQKANRQATNFLIEQDMSSIYRQLNIEIDREIAQKLGIEFDENEAKNKKVNIINKDSLVIRRNLSLSQLINILKRIDKLTKAKDNFALNYLVPARKMNYKNSELFSILKTLFTEKKYKAFELVGDEYVNYILNSRKYIVKDAENNVFIRKEQPIRIKDIFEELEKKGIKITSSFVHTFLKKWTIYTTGETGKIELPETCIFDAIQGHIELNNTRDPVYLFNGEWYVFDIKYADALTNEYEAIFDKYFEKSKAILSKFSLLHSAKTETEYNKILEREKNILVTHTVLVDNIEIADAIFWDSCTVYLMHNKGKFNGEGTREVINQILTSAEYIQRILQSLNRDELIEKYYNDIIKKRPISSKKVTAKEFNSIMLEKNICFIAGYLSGFRKKTTATYSKYLTIEAEKRLGAKGYEFVSMSVTK